MESYKLLFFPIKPGRETFRRRGKKMERPVDPSILEYVLRIKKEEVASCEAISHAFEFECEMDAWMEKLDDGIEEEEVKE